MSSHSSYSTWSHLKVSKAPLLHLKNISRCLQLHSKAPSSTMHGSKRPALPVSTRRLLQLFFSFSFFLFLFTFSSTSTFADISVDNPATGKCCGTISALTAVSANAALEAAKSAAEGELHTCIFIFHVFNMFIYYIGWSSLQRYRGGWSVLRTQILCCACAFCILVKNCLHKLCPWKPLCFLSTFACFPLPLLSFFLQAGARCRWTTALQQLQHMLPSSVYGMFISFFFPKIKRVRGGSSAGVVLRSATFDSDVTIHLVLPTRQVV